MRTDTQRLDWILAALDSGNGEPLERLQAAYTLELRGRIAMDAAMGAKIVEPGEPMPALTAIDLAIAEVGRIRNVKGFSEEQDDSYVNGELADAAMCYFDTLDDGVSESHWPWAPETFKPSEGDRKKELTKGIALALCELDRVIRAERRAILEGNEMAVAVTEREFKVDDDSEGIGMCPKVLYDGPPEHCGLRKPREFKVGDRVMCNCREYSFPTGSLGTIIGNAVTGWDVSVDVKCGMVLYFRESELEHVDD
jgi:hypothetical protein